MFPSNESVTWRPAFLHRVPWEWFPGFTGTIRTLRLPIARPAALRRPSLGGTAVASAVRSRTGRRARPGPGCSGCGNPLQPLFQRGDDRASQVPEEPSCAFALLSDPGRIRRTRPSTVDGRGSRAIDHESSDEECFEAQSHGFNTRCLRFVGPVARPPRKTRFRLPASSTRRDSTRRVPTRGFSSASYIASSSLGLPWRNNRLLQRKRGRHPNRSGT